MHHREVLPSLGDRRRFHPRRRARGDPADMADYTLDAKASSFACLGASVAPAASSSGYQEHVNAALAAGATVGEVVGVLIAVSPAVGLTRVISAAPALGLAVGYDAEAALEMLTPEEDL